MPRIRTTSKTVESSPKDWDSWCKAVVKKLITKYKFLPGWAELCVDGDWKGLVYKYFDGGKSPEECAKAINDTGANESFESAQAGGEIVYKYEVTEFLRKEFQSAPVEAKTKKGGNNEGLTNFRFNCFS